MYHLSQLQRLLGRGGGGSRVQVVSPRGVTLLHDSKEAGSFSSSVSAAGAI